MSKHDTWAKLKKGHPFEHIEHLFPEDFPMRDPFGMGFNQEANIVLWFMDIDRLNSNQKHHLAFMLAQKFGVSVEQVMVEVTFNGFPINGELIEAMSGGAETYRRTIELINFQEAHPVLTGDSWRNFCKQQERDWINGDKVPEPMPDNYEDIDPRLKSPELKEYYEQEKKYNVSSLGKYSIFDFVIGIVPITLLHENFPEGEWVSEEDLEDWEN